MVNTFIPYSSFRKCAKVLDNKRLGKQRVEAKQIINVIKKIKKDPNAKSANGKTLAWSRHPVVLMWKDHVPALKLYYNCIVDEWISRGYLNTMKKFRVTKFTIPWFMHNKQVIESFRAALLRKNHAHYSRFFTANVNYMSRSYVWISALTDEQISKMKEGINLPIKEICKEIK